jgi:release factor glutamine methyltransferase
VATLRGAGRSATPRLDAELLLAHVLGVQRAVLYRDAASTRAPAPAAFTELIARRAAGEPVAYLVGRRAFRRLELAVDPRVLVPRPETELLVEVALRELRHGARVLDVGTGSGAVALALADERDDLILTGCDVSAGALQVARANARRLGLDVPVRSGDLVLDGAWDAVVSNPPYVADGELLPTDVADHEPAIALYGGGDDGLAVTRALIARVAAARVPWLALEVGAGRAGAVAGVMVAAGMAGTSVHRDLAGIERVVVGRRPC